MKKFKEYTNNIGGVAQAYGTTIPTGDLRTEPLNAHALKATKLQYLKLLNTALKAVPGSEKQKETIKHLNIHRKQMGQKPLTIPK